MYPSMHLAGGGCLPGVTPWIFDITLTVMTGSTVGVPVQICIFSIVIWYGVVSNLFFLWCLCDGSKKPLGFSSISPGTHHIKKSSHSPSIMQQRCKAIFGLTDFFSRIKQM